MQIKEFLNSVCEQIKYKPITEEISDELQNHIEEQKEYYIEKGMNEKEASSRFTRGFFWHKRNLIGYKKYI